MTSKRETSTNLENGPAQYPERLTPASSEAVYDRLTGYGFARRYVEGKVVADIGWGEIGYGSRLLAETAASVVGLTSSPKAAERASAVYSAPNVSYRSVSLLELPYPEGYFDIVLALGAAENLEQPESLVKEARRVLKQDGVLIVSTLDKKADANYREGTNGRQGMYVPKFQELLGRHFGHVRVYRQGAVAGGFVFPASREVTGTPVESARVSSTIFDPGVGPPTTRSIIAVCSDAEALVQGEQPYLLLDRDRRVFDECEERAEDVELLRGEIQQMQETEVQAFLDVLEWHARLAADANRYLLRLFGTMRFTGRRLLVPYRRLQARNRRSS